MSAQWLENVTHERMQDAGPFTGGPVKGVLHTTEGSGWPDYADGTIAPHFTCRWDAAKRRLVVRQHIALNRAAKALRNEPGGVQTNKDSAIQVELVGTCNPTFAGALYWPKANDEVITALASFMRILESRCGIKRRAATTWIGYPLSYGTDAPQRFTLAQWDAWDGWCGHMHVPENSHGDPGSLPVGRLVGSLASPASLVKAPSSSTKFPLADKAFFSVDGRNGFGSATERKHIRSWQAQMARRGWAMRVDGLFGQESQQTLIAFQKEKRLTPDGLLGKRSWDAAWAARLGT